MDGSYDLEVGRWANQMNSDHEINKAVGLLWASFIESINFNLWDHEISFVLRLYESDQVQKHKLVFHGVSSFFYVNGKGDSRFRTINWENAELSEIYYFDEPEDHIRHQSDKVGTPQFVAEPNFYLEIWSTVLMIEAKAVTVDDIRYAAKPEQK